MRRQVMVEWLGRLRYRAASDLQEEWANDCADGGPERLLLLEHEPVITLGRNARAAHIRTPAPVLQDAGIALHNSSRGGDVTYHGPGQLVAYPILNLALRGMGVVAYVDALEEAAVRVAAHYGLAAERDPANRGVWVNENKIAAVGVRVARRITRHGLAFNVSTDLTAFAHIVPCGVPNRGVTSLEQELGRHVAFHEVVAVFKAAFAGVFESDLIDHDERRIRQTTP